MEKEIEIFSLDLEARRPEEKATFFKQTLEGRKARKAREAREMDESADNPEISQPSKPKLMDSERRAFAEKYLEDIQERHSVTTEASDSGLGTHAAASELGMEEISETSKLRLKDLSKDVTHKLNIMLNADEATMEKFQRFFGLKSRNLPEWKLEPGLSHSQLESIQQDEVSQRRELERLEKEVAALKERRETMFKPQMEELQEEIEKAKTAISTAMDKWIHNQDKFTCFAVFVISDDKWSIEAMLEECIMEKLALIPDHAKLVVTPSEWETIGTVPETLHVMYNVDSYSIYSFYSLMIEIFNKRRETLDLVSMMQELYRTAISKRIIGRECHTKDNLSTLLRFQKTEENVSV
ncbi:hypothetical protein OS493_018833 [Desmophyllum pertusum]|uniref:Uncharacterized protein n=1 Tax=Desmophyllum pertusum TaxID=174260 RepID=A0A9W9ZC46_9CNID|nr:hypothetical protein OS493_018833 [Desmophyllum pertusum]